MYVIQGRKNTNSLKVKSIAKKMEVENKAANPNAKKIKLVDVVDRIIEAGLVHESLQKYR